MTETDTDRPRVQCQHCRQEMFTYRLTTAEDQRRTPPGMFPLSTGPLHVVEHKRDSGETCPGSHEPVR